MTDRLAAVAAVLAETADRLRRLEPEPEGAPGGLVVAGTGIRVTAHLTLETLTCVVDAERVLYVVADPAAERLLRSLNPAATESLAGLYGRGKSRRRTYEEMVEAILSPVRAGRRTCALFYGHPGVFVWPAHEAVRRARSEGLAARMLPAVSAEDCLYADLGVDPASAGCQAYEASDFLINGRRLDTTCHVVVWQIGMIGRWDHPGGEGSPAAPGALQLLIERLAESYSVDQRMAVYEASWLPGGRPRIDWTTLGDLASAGLSEVSTLYVPPARPPRTDFFLAQTLGAV